MRHRLTREEYLQGIKQSNVSVLARVLTLLESRLPEDQELTISLLQDLPEENPDSIRIGITGIPGAGKSSLLDVWIPLIPADKKVAVLAIDPSSPLGGGSLLGDKTRMQRLQSLSNVYVRPSPSMGLSGGMHFATPDAMRVLEAAGFEYLFLETVGVGQNESEVRNLCDLVVFLWIHGTGDELQLLKRGVTEIADLVLLQKAELLDSSDRLLKCQQLAQWLQLPAFPSSSYDPDLVKSSWESVLNSIGKIAGTEKKERRVAQKLALFKSSLLKEISLELEEKLVDAQLLSYFNKNKQYGPTQAARLMKKQFPGNSFFGA